ncbi:hypothetical protein, partial [Rhizobium sp.]|uniref:hypothetical protein n=1 Tax=Rhizobium sp. TaxID=391 RepID=UPI0028AE85E1
KSSPVLTSPPRIHQLQIAIQRVNHDGSLYASAFFNSLLRRLFMPIYPYQKSPFGDDILNAVNTAKRKARRFDVYPDFLLAGAVG